MYCSVMDSVANSLWDNVRGNVSFNVDARVGRVREAVSDSVRDGMWGNVRDSAWDSIRACAKDRVEDSRWSSVHGAHSAAVLASYRYYREVGGLTKQTDKLSGLWELAQSAGWLCRIAVRATDANFFSQPAELQSAPR